MKSPGTVLPYGTRIRTRKDFTPSDTRGFLVADRHLMARKRNALGLIEGWVPGHGGDVYWVRHAEGDARADPCPVAAYLYTEFDLAEE